MKPGRLFAMLCLLFAASGAMAGSAPPGTAPLTPAEIRTAFIGRTWSGSTPSRPRIMTAEERKLFAQQRGKPSGKFKEYYAPNGTIMGWVGRTDFEARVDGRWRINGNQLCVTYKIARFWKNSSLRTKFSSGTCYRLVYKSGTLLMADSGGQYFRPSLSKGNSAAGRYTAVGK